MVKHAQRFNLTKAPGIDSIHLAHILFGVKHTIGVTFRNEQGRDEDVKMTVLGTTHENGSGKSLIVTGYPVGNTSLGRRLVGQIQFWTRDPERWGWIQFEFLQ